MKQVWFTAALCALAAPAAAQPGDEDKPAVVRAAEAKVNAAQGAQMKPGAKSQATVAEEVAAHDRALAAADKQERTHVELSFSTRPSVAARVYHGKKLLGTTPFSVQWKHDSGPVDVVVRAPGYLPVNTRAYSFRDDAVVVELTRPADASRLLGYKKKIEPPPDEPAAGEEALVPPAGAPGPGLPKPAPPPAPAPAAP